MFDVCWSLFGNFLVLLLFTTTVSGQRGRFSISFHALLWVHFPPQQNQI
jgi:hypothetical protein